MIKFKGRHLAFKLMKLGLDQQSKRGGLSRVEMRGRKQAGTQQLDSVHLGKFTIAEVKRNLVDAVAVKDGEGVAESR